MNGSTRRRWIVRILYPPMSLSAEDLSTDEFIQGWFIRWRFSLPMIYC